MTRETASCAAWGKAGRSEGFREFMRRVGCAMLVAGMIWIAVAGSTGSAETENLSVVPAGITVDPETEVLDLDTAGITITDPEEVAALIEYALIL